MFKCFFSRVVEEVFKPSIAVAIKSFFNMFGERLSALLVGA